MGGHMNPSSTQIAAALSGAMGSSSAGLALSGMYGTIAAVHTGPPPTVDVYLNNNSTGAQPSTANGLAYMSDYNPVVGDAVFLVAGQAGMRTSYLVFGTQAGSSSGGGSSGVPIGAIQIFPVTITYPNWLPCNGGTFSAVTYPALNTLLGGNTLPNLVNFLPMGAGSTVSLGSTAGASTQTLTTAQLAAHNHGHNHTGPSHTHTGPSHTHTDSGHSHNHNHSVGGGSSNYALYSSATDTPSGSGHFSVGGNAANTDSDNTSGNASLNNSGTGATGSSGTGNTSTDNTSAGSGSSFSILNPVTGVAYYIKAA